MWASHTEASWSSLSLSQLKSCQSRRTLDSILDPHQQCQDAFVCPDGLSIVSLIKACAELRDADRGGCLHAKIARKGLLENDMFAGNALVDMYARCGIVTKAQEVFDSLRIRDVVSWTALIGGYARHGCGMQALKCFEQMRVQEVAPNHVTYICALKACGCVASAIMGRNLHDEIERRGLLKDDIVLGNALIDMYAKCCMLADTRRVFEGFLLRDKISWSALISGYTESNEGAEALVCFTQMQIEGVLPDTITSMCVLKACGTIKDITKGKEIHATIIGRGLPEVDLVVANTLMDMYAECGSLRGAQDLFHKLSTPDIISWNTLIDGSCKQEDGEEALHLAKRMQLEGVFPDIVTYVCCLKACSSMRDIHKGKELHAIAGLFEVKGAIGNGLINMYSKCGWMLKAQEVFDKLKDRDVVTWTTLIAGYANHHNVEEVLKCFLMMQAEGVSPNATTFLCIFNACGASGAVSKCTDIHAEIERRGFVAKEVTVGNALVELYAKSGMFTKAHEVFNVLPSKDVASWNALMKGYAKHDQGEEVLDCFALMKLEGVSLNSITYICGLKACGSMRAAFEGIDIHIEIARKGLLSIDRLVGNALVDMYAKCGLLAKAKEALHELPVQDIVSWTSLISGYTLHEHYEQALDCVDQVRLQGPTPDAATFACGLKACKGAGALDKGTVIHCEIARRGLLEQDLVIGNLLIEMYATCGSLPKAHRVFDNLPAQDTVSWTALLEGYVWQGEIDCAFHIFERMKEEGKRPDAVSYVWVLNACVYEGSIDIGRMYFEEMSKVHGISPSIEHYSCMVDLTCRVGLLENAVTIINHMPCDPDPILWFILLDACGKYGNVKAGRNAFKQTIGLNLKDASAYVRMCRICGDVDVLENATLNQQTGGNKQLYIRGHCW